MGHTRRWNSAEEPQIQSIWIMRSYNKPNLLIALTHLRSGLCFRRIEYITEIGDDSSKERGQRGKDRSRS